MAKGLLSRILRHAAEEGWLAPGDIICDPFGGIGSTGILGAYEGYQCVLCELEAKFVDLAKQNFALHAKKLEKLGCPQPVIIQGDSRELCKLLSGCDCIVSSPPYSKDAVHGGNTVDVDKLTGNRPGPHSQVFTMDGYGQTPGQLGVMKPGSVDVVMSSPPYAESLKGDGTQNETAAESHAKRTDKSAGGPLGQSQRTQGYGSKGNLGNLKPGNVDMVCSSPPWENQEGSMQSKKFKDPEDSAKMLADRCAEGKTKGHYATPAAIKRAMDKANQQTYGNSSGQLGQDKGDTFWSAAKIIVQQCHQLLKPGGVAIWVVKAFVRNKKIVDFPGDWQRLCESVGFKTLHIHHAMLIKPGPQTFWDEPKLGRQHRRSFFRNLADTKAAWRNYWDSLSPDKQSSYLKQEKTLAKAVKVAFIASGEDEYDWNEDTRIDFENVLCMRKEP